MPVGVKLRDRNPLAQSRQLSGMDEQVLDVVAVRDVGPDTVAIDFETPEAFDAQPGQFVKLTLGVDGEDISRFYTISSPTVDEAFEITVGTDPDGELAPQLGALEAGDGVRIAGPFGSDYYEGESRAVVLAGGPGVGPAVGIAERALDDGNEAAVVYQDDAPVHEDRLDALAEAGALVSVIDSEESLTEPVADAIEDGGQVFIYGFADFLDAATEALEAAGVSTDDAKVENFG
ncbi:3-phenylpropionate/trans-cinnamate dioxygenase ferredoxin reductase subunit [Haloarcula quadrata]|uniref:3-phenylpropionate/trans-cinnamate dioxygenase ferredoxin reductase subunit n=2 Tax=Haloarcula quadrata TaxID=182779 RepID=A0A495R5Y0_9EURY|nr:3-phenylpropionate/trans-cinnamate dioxygenase ferredoxin reductase subunit [Haloarcula quadrata]